MSSAMDERKMNWRYVTVAGIIIVASIGALNYSGFCWKEKRWLSDDEKINSAVRYILDSGYFRDKYFKNGVVEFKRPAPIPYKNIREFYEKNADCCRLVEKADDGYAVSFADKICGGPRWMARIRFRIYSIDSDGGVSVSVKEKFPLINNCGYSSIDF